MWPFTKNVPAHGSHGTTYRQPIITGMNRESAAKVDRDRVLLQKALKLVLTFAERLVSDPPDLEVRDEKELPASKTVMIEAFRLVLCAETRPNWHTALYYAGLQLSHYWPDIGERMTVPDGLFPEADTQAILAEARRKTDWNAVVAFSAAYSRVGPEQDRIAALFDQAIIRPEPGYEESLPLSARPAR